MARTPAETMIAQLAAEAGRQRTQLMTYLIGRGCQICGDPATEAAHIRAMFVRGDWTRRGLGTRILEICEAAAKAEGFRDLTLMATLPGFELYRRYGFRETERTAISLPDGVVVECVAMDKPID